MSEQLCDVMDVNRRAETLFHVLRDTEEVTGIFSLKEIKNAKIALDLGMGRGALARALSSINPDLHIIGNDEVTTYIGDTFYKLYDSRIGGDISQDKTWEKIWDETKPFGPPDFIFGIGLPPQVVTQVVGKENMLRKHLNRNGKVLLLTDFNIPPNIGSFQHFRGNGSINENILMLKK